MLHRDGKIKLKRNEHGLEKNWVTLFPDFVSKCMLFELVYILKKQQNKRKDGDA